jgi:hypothetical protein
MLASPLSDFATTGAPRLAQHRPKKFSRKSRKEDPFTGKTPRQNASNTAEIRQIQTKHTRSTPKARIN